MPLKWKELFVRLLLILAFMNTGLRPSVNSPFSLFRLVAPPFILLILLLDFRRYTKSFFWFTGLLLWGLAAYVLFHKTTFYLLYAEYLHFFFLYGVFVLVKHHADLSQDFAVSFFSFLDHFVVFTLILTAVEYGFGLHFFSAVQSGRVCASVFFWNENELCMAFCTMIPLYMIRGYEKKKILDFLKIGVILWFCYEYDCKLSLSAIFLYVIMLLLLFPRRKSILFFVFLFAMISAFLFFFFIFPYIDFHLETGQHTTTYSFHRDIYQPLMHLLTLTPFRLPGSVYVRTDAIIYGLRELLDSLLLGMGPGGSYYMLSLSKYRLDRTISMHNFTAHMLTEFGMYFLVSVVWFYTHVIRTFLKKNTRFSKMQTAYAFFLIFLSSQASAAIFSNYFFWTTIFFVFLIPDFYPSAKEREQIEQQQALLRDGKAFL